MSTEPESPLHDFADRAVRESLQRPENIRSFLKSAVPELAPGFECDEARVLPTAD
jgi:hypothetical protein